MITTCRNLAVHVDSLVSEEVFHAKSLQQLKCGC